MKLTPLIFAALLLAGCCSLEPRQHVRTIDYHESGHVILLNKVHTAHVYQASAVQIPNKWVRVNNHTGRRIDVMKGSKLYQMIPANGSKVFFKGQEILPP